MTPTRTSWATLAATLVLAACGGNQNPTLGRGDLLQNPPPRTASRSAAVYSAELQSGGPSGQTLLGLATAGTGSTVLPCGVDVQYIQYGTVGGKGEPTHASGALMVPTGPGANCSGARPIVLFAHGTAAERRYNLANWADASNPASSEANLVASQFAAKGYIVVAPNYAGYDSSTLPYHPFLVADQQSKDMIDALTAARKALPGLVAPVSDNGRLFITGISQGGHVAMATHRAMRLLNMTVTASAPLEPVSALLNYGDYIMSGRVPAASTVLIPMLINGFQKTYGSLYSMPSEYFAAQYAPGIEAAFPGAYSFTELTSRTIVPPAALFSDGAATTPTAFAPLFAGGVGSGNLVTDSARNGYLVDLPSATPGHALRKALAANDMLSFSPAEPMLLCGGAADPTVFFSVNAEASAIALQGKAHISLLDLEGAYPLTLGLANVNKVAWAGALQSGFSNAVAATQAAAPSDPLAVVKVYHGKLAPTFCVAAAQAFFSQTL